MKARILVVFFALFSAHAQAASCDSSCTTQLTNLSQFERLAAVQKVGARSLEVVKLVYRRSGDGAPEVYFFDTPRFRYHYDFSQRFLRYPFSIGEFNKNYIGSGEEREFNLASLVLWKKSDKPEFLLELFNGDTIEVRYLQELFNQVAKRLKVKDASFAYHPLGHQQEVDIKTDPRLPFKTTTDLYGDIKYLPLNEGVAYGTLKFFDPNECYDNTHIVVYSNIPNDMGLLGGVITEEIQTPLSHINVKSMNRGTVNMSLKNAKTVLAEYRDKPVKIQVKGDRYVVTLLDAETAAERIEEFWKQRKPSAPFELTSKNVPEYNNAFVNLTQAFPSQASPRPARHKELISFIGAKATNLALLYRLRYKGPQTALRFKVPAGLAVPFQFFDEFMQLRQQGLDLNAPEKWSTPDQEIRTKLKAAGIIESTGSVSFCAVKPVLKEIRELIQRAQVPTKQLELFKHYIVDDNNSPIHQSKIVRLRLRSSTNSEDVEGFSGAGLYNSKGQWLYDKDKVTKIRKKDRPTSWKKLAKKLREKIAIVYSGVWNNRAFEEREWYSINKEKHLQVKVGILLHRGFPFKELEGKTGELANGVAITSNVYDHQSEIPSVYLNSQHYDLAVTNPPLAEEIEERGEDPSVPYKTEEILLNAFSANEEKTGSWDEWKDWSYEVISRSSILQGSPVLKKRKAYDETKALGKVLYDLNRKIAQVYRKSSFDFAIDVEWKFIGDTRELWIKQARPFQKQSLQDSGNNAGFSMAKKRSRKAPRGPRLKKASQF